MKFAEDLRSATSSNGVQPSPAYQRLQDLLISNWGVDEAPVFDQYGPVAGWCFTPNLPKSMRLKDGAGSIYAFSDQALHICYHAKAGVMRSAPAHYRIDYADMASVQFPVVASVGVYFVIMEDSVGDRLASLSFQDHGLDGPTTGVEQAGRIAEALAAILG